MGIVVIHEGEERPLRLPAARQPVEELAMDHRRRLAESSASNAPRSAHEGSQQVDLKCSLRKRSSMLSPSRGRSIRAASLKALSSREEVILVDGETPTQPRVGAAIGRVGDESGRGVAPGPQVLRQRGMGRVQRGEPTGRELVGPPAREEAGVGRQGPRRGRLHPVEPDPAPRQDSSVGLVGRS